MLDITIATEAVTAADLWTSDDEAATMGADPGAFTGLELVQRLARGTWPTVAALITDSTEAGVPSRGVVCTDGVTAGIYVGRGKAVVPAGRRYAVVNYTTRLPRLLQVPGVTYTGGV